MGRDRLDEETLGEIADALYDAQPMDHYHQLAKAVAAAVEPLLAEKDKTLTEAVEMVRSLAEYFPAGSAQSLEISAFLYDADAPASPVSLSEPSGVGPARVVPSERADRLVCVHEWERTHDDHEVCRLCGADTNTIEATRPVRVEEQGEEN